MRTYIKYKAVGIFWLMLAAVSGCQTEPHQAGSTTGSKTESNAESKVGSNDTVAELKDSIQKTLLEAMTENDTLPGASVRVIAPSLGLDWGAGVGYADDEQTIPFTSAHPIRISSVTKPFVAATIFRLFEQGRVDLDAPMSNYLDGELKEIVGDGPYDPEAITVRQLVNHTSGLMDVFNTKSFEAYYISVIEGGVTKSFTLEEQVQIAVNGGEPTGAPGARQAYTDTGYILLGAIVEELTQQDMGAAVRQLSGYGALNLQNTWWEVYETPPADALPRAKQYFGAFEGDGFGEQPFDLFGGGGMISSADDLSRYFWALFHGEVFQSPSTFDLMNFEVGAEVERADDKLLMRHGLQVFDINGDILIGHTGWWGVRVYYSPADDVLVAVNWLQQLAGGAMSERAKSIVAAVLQAARANS